MTIFENNFKNYLHNHKKEINTLLFSERGYQLYKDVYGHSYNGIEKFYDNPTKVKRILSRFKYNVSSSDNITLKDFYFFSKLLNIPPLELINIRETGVNQQIGGFHQFHDDKVIEIFINYLNEYNPKTKDTYGKWIVLPLISHIKTNSVLYMIYNAYYYGSVDVNFFMTSPKYSKIYQSFSLLTMDQDLEYGISKIKYLGKNYHDAKRIFILEANIKERQFIRLISKNMAPLYDSEIADIISSIDPIFKKILK